MPAALACDHPCAGGGPISTANPVRSVPIGYVEDARSQEAPYLLRTTVRRVLNPSGIASRDNFYRWARGGKQRGNVLLVGSCDHREQQVNICDRPSIVRRLFRVAYIHKGRQMLRQKVCSLPVIRTNKGQRDPMSGRAQRFDRNTAVIMYGICKNVV